jgi:hypothetical protein
MIQDVSVNIARVYEHTHTHIHVHVFIHVIFNDIYKACPGAFAS